MLILETTCPNCEGRRWVDDPNALEWFQRHSGCYRNPDLQDTVPLPKHCICGEKMPKDDSAPCGECEGVGTLLTPDGQTLMAFLNKHRPRSMG